VIARWVDWCARNRFLVFTGTVLLVLAGIWSMNRIPLDALPDISDVEVIIHTPWEEPPISSKIRLPTRLSPLCLPRPV
jgi:Cu(I)/Ag(I) efflux system membrane protein CusA/SilA